MFMISSVLSFFSLLIYLIFFLYAKKVKSFLFDINIFTKESFCGFLLFITPLVNLALLGFAFSMVCVLFFGAGILSLTHVFFFISERFARPACEEKFIYEVISFLKGKDFSWVEEEKVENNAK